MTEKGEQFTKQVDFVAKDDQQQIATGIVMVPDTVDLQGDFAREETIREFAEQFENFVEAGEASGGVMHAVWPSDWMSLERNEVLDEPTEIGGATAPEGAWVQAWKFHDDELWSLVDDGILEGNSIGAINVSWSDPMEQDDLPDDVDVAEDYPEDDPVWELLSGIIREVSTVDIPAVPDAQILQTKGAEEKRLSDYLGNRDGFIEEAQERGHAEEEAERLWDLLNRAVDVEGAGEPGKQSFFARVGKAALSAIPGSDDDRKASEAPDGGYETAPTANNPDAGMDGAEKEGRTLSRQNRESLYATIDASLDILQDAGVDHGMQRFTDREDTSFDLSEHTARDWATDDDDDEDEDGDGASVDPSFESASGSDTPGDDMTDTDDPMADAPEWARSINEQIEENSKRINELADGGDPEKDAGGDGEADGDGGEDAGKDGEPDKSGDADDEPPEWAKSINEQVQENADRIENLAKASGHSQQLEGGESTDGTSDSKFSSAWSKTLGIPTSGSGGDL